MNLSTRSTLAALVAPLALAACMQPEAAAPERPGLIYETARDPLPADVAGALPPGLARGDLLIGYRPGSQSYCYYYRAGGQILPLSTPQLRAAGHSPDQPHCVG